MSIGFLEGFYYRPRADKELLKKYNAGLIATWLLAVKSTMQQQVIMKMQMLL